jgi:type I restriction enzyme, S subunit
MKAKSVPSSWLERDGRRLDCNPYMSGALEAKVLLEGLKVRKDALRDVTLNGLTGIFNGPRFARSYVDDPAQGVRFMGSTDILSADLTSLPRLSKRQVAANPRLVVHTDWTLITYSGTIGRMAYARPEMEGMAGSQHFMRVVPDTEKIPPGYLYAYLSSKFGVPLVIGGTYGAIIQHIEPEHIANLPVPRLGGGTEGKANELVREAAQLRSEASSELLEVQKLTLEVLGLPDLGEANVSRYSVNAIAASKLNSRLDAPYHSAVAARALAAVGAAKAPSAPLSDVVKRYFKPPMFKRIWVDGPEYGRQFISGVDAYRFQAESVRYVSFKTPRFDDFLLEEGTVIFQAAGQIYGLFAQPIFVSGWLIGVFAADDLYRLVPNTKSDGGFLYAFFRTAVGQVLLKRQACGNSIPRVWDPHIRDINIPWPEETIREEIGKRVVAAHAEIERARVAETDAIALVEKAIEKGATS